MILTNNIIIAGIKNKEFEVHHLVKEEKFYCTTIDVKRNSDGVDTLPIILTEKLLNDDIMNAKFLKITGQIRTYNKKEGGVEIYIFVKQIQACETEEYINEVSLIGRMCIKGKFRSTFSGRKIQDFILATNRLFNKSDYIPVLAWGANANFVSNMEVSQMLTVTGRLQSREYNKTINNEVVKKIAYEVSSSNVTIYNEEQEQLEENK